MSRDTIPQCREPVENAVGHCTRRAATRSGYCYQHRASAVAAFVARWRREHWLDVYAPPWMCPLCGMAVQTPTTGFPEECAEEHRHAHGDDWQRYLAVGEPNETWEG